MDTAPQDSQDNLYDRLVQDARKDLRMVRDDQPLTADIRRKLIKAARDYMTSRRVATKRYGHAEFAQEAGLMHRGQPISPSTLSGIFSGQYMGDSDTYLRQIDRFLAAQEERADRHATSGYASIHLAEVVFGVITMAKQVNSMAAIIMQSGQGKSTIARAYAATNPSAVLIRAEEQVSQDRHIIAALYRELGLRGGAQSVTQRREELRKRIEGDRMLIILVDEAQKLRPSGLEMLRDIHDTSDPSGQFCVPIILFGDHDFRKLLEDARGHSRSGIKAQLVRRIYPVFDSETVKDIVPDDPGKLYSEEDIVRILAARSVRLVGRDTTAWLRNIANQPGYGAIGMIVALVHIATRSSGGKPIALAHVRKALRKILPAKVADKLDADASVGLPPAETRKVNAG